MDALCNISAYVIRQREKYLLIVQFSVSTCVSTRNRQQAPAEGNTCSISPHIPRSRWFHKPSELVPLDKSFSARELWPPPWEGPTVELGEHRHPRTRVPSAGRGTGSPKSRWALNATWEHLELQGWLWKLSSFAK